MEEKNGLERSVRKNTTGARIAGIGSCVLAVLGYMRSHPVVRLSFWVVAVLLGLLALRQYRRRRAGGWSCVLGIFGIILASLPMTLATFLPRHPSVGEMNVPPLNYVDAPLQQVLQDLSRKAHEQGHRLNFQMWDEELMARRVTFRTTRSMSFRELLSQLTETAGCSFRPELGMGWDNTAIYRQERRQRQGDPRFMIRWDRIDVPGGLSGRDAPEQQTR